MIVPVNRRFVNDVTEPKVLDFSLVFDEGLYSMVVTCGVVELFDEGVDFSSGSRDRGVDFIDVVTSINKCVWLFVCFVSGRW